jgi:hypothetical protein
MSSRFPTDKLPPLDLGPWRRVPNLLIVAGAVLRRWARARATTCTAISSSWAIRGWWRICSA